MQLVAYYAGLVRSELARQAPAALETCLPTLGIEIIGNMFRWVAQDMRATQAARRTYHVPPWMLGLERLARTLALLLIHAVQGACSVLRGESQQRGGPAIVPRAANLHSSSTCNT